ncbi:MAG: hypothetical protein HC869_13665 [Rhodospirillales bacterium]|nr:hypothetical protein [Rhodospirillales bacterium]
MSRVIDYAFGHIAAIEKRPTSTMKSPLSRRALANNAVPFPAGIVLRFSPTVPHDHRRATRPARACSRLRLITLAPAAKPNEVLQLTSSVVSHRNLIANGHALGRSSLDRLHHESFMHFPRR